MKKILLIIMVLCISIGLYARPKLVSKSGTELVISDCTDITKWFVGSGSGNVKDTSVDGVSHCIVVTSSTGDDTRICDTISAGVDLTNYPVFRVKMWINDSTAFLTGNNWMIGFYNSTTSFTNGFRTYYDFGTNITTNEKVRSVQGGHFIEWVVTKANLGRVGSGDWSTIKQVRFQNPSTTGKTLKIAYSRISAYQSAYTKGTVMFGFDDSYASLMSADSVFKAKGWYFGMFPRLSNIGTAGYITSSNADTLTAHGHEWYTHGYNHIQFTSTTDSIIRYEINQCQTYAKSKSTIASPNFMSTHAYRLGAYPSQTGGALFSQHTDTVISPYVDYMRLTEYWPSQYAYSPVLNNLSFKASNPGNQSLTLTNVKAYVDSAMKYNLPYFIWFHNLKDSAAYNGSIWGLTNYKDLCTYIDTAYVQKGTGQVKPPSFMFTYSPDSIIIKGSVSKTSTSYSVACSLSTDGDSAKLYLWDSIGGVWTKRDSSTMLAGGSKTTLTRSGASGATLYNYKVTALTNTSTTDSSNRDTVRTSAIQRTNRVFIILGQSNAQEHSIHGVCSAAADSLIMRSTWSDSVTQTTMTFVTHPTVGSMCAGLLNIIRSTYPTGRLVSINAAVGSTALVHGSAKLWSARDTGSYFAKAVKQFRILKTQRDAVGDTTILCGIFWFQGESDAIDTTVSKSQYLTALNTLASNFRDTFQLPSLHFYSFQIAKTTTVAATTGIDRSWTAIRQAQSDFDQGPTGLNHMCGVTINLTFADNMHLDSVGINRCGRMGGYTFNQVMAGQDYRGPVIQSIAKGTDYSQILVTCSKNVSGNFYTGFKNQLGNTATAASVSNNVITLTFPTITTSIKYFATKNIDSTKVIKGVTSDSLVLEPKDSVGLVVPTNLTIDTTGYYFAVLPKVLKYTSAPANFNSGNFPVVSNSNTYKGSFVNCTSGKGYNDGKLLFGDQYGQLRLSQNIPNQGNTSTATISAWITPTGTISTTQTIGPEFKYTNGTTYTYYQLFINSSRQLGVALRQGTSTTDKQTTSTAQTWFVGTSYFIEGIKNADGTLRLRINGVEPSYNASNTYSSGTVDFTGATNGLGDYPSNFSFPTNSISIDYLTVYGTARSISQGQNDYFLGSDLSGKYLLKDSTDGSGRLITNVHASFTSVTPSSARRSTVITIKGSGFNAVPGYLHFNSLDLGPVQSWCDTMIVDTIPSNAPRGYYRVIVNNGAKTDTLLNGIRVKVPSITGGE